MNVNIQTTSNKSLQPTARLRASHQSSFDEVGCYSLAAAEVRRWMSSFSESMSAIEEIKVRLRKYPQAKYESDGASISVFPVSDGGFTVSLIEHQNSYTVSFDGWHEEFQDREEALNCFAFGLSSECRLKEVRHGNFAYKWTVESSENGEWVEDSTTGLFLFPFWKKKEVRYLQNRLLGEESTNI